MATDFIMPRLPDQQQQPYAPQFYPQLAQQPSAHFANQPHAPQPSQTQIQHQLHSANSSRQISPLSTSNSASPTSPKSYHGRQLRPLYIPAVLRPTDYPSKKTPTTKGNEDDDSLKASSSWTSLTGLGALGRLTRRSTGDSGKCMDNDLNMDMFPKPTAQPTREHWKVSTYRSPLHVVPPATHIPYHLWPYDCDATRNISRCTAHDHFRYANTISPNSLMPKP